MKHFHKTVHVVGYEFDSLPAHVKVSGRGSGATLRVACQRAIADLFTQHQLRHKQTGAFKLSVVVIAERAPDDLDRSIVPRPSAEADDALGVPKSWREKHKDGGAS